MQRRGRARGAPLAASARRRSHSARIVAAPAEKAEVLAIERGRRIRGDQRALGEKGARAAHRIEQRSALRRQCCGQPARSSTAAATFSLSGARPPSRAIAAPMQALAGEIQRHQRRGALDVQMQQHVGALGLDVRPLAGGFAQTVADRILEQLRAVNRVPDGLVAAAAVARQGRAAARNARASRCASPPRKCSVRAAGVESEPRLKQHAGRGARPQAGAVADFERALELHIVTALADVASAPNCASSSAKHRGRTQRARSRPSRGHCRSRCTALGTARANRCVGVIREVSHQHLVHVDIEAGVGSGRASVAELLFGARRCPDSSSDRARASRRTMRPARVLAQRDTAGKRPALIFSADSAICGARVDAESAVPCRCRRLCSRRAAARRRNRRSSSSPSTFRHSCLRARNVGQRLARVLARNETRRKVCAEIARAPASSTRHDLDAAGAVRAELQGDRLRAAACVRRL